jgi:hypothetical protein
MAVRFQVLEIVLPEGCKCLVVCEFNQKGTMADSGIGNPRDWLLLLLMSIIILPSAFRGTE